MCFLLLSPVLSQSGNAQGAGFQGGGTASPNQFYVGSHFELTLGNDDFLFRPGIDGGRGDGFTTANINFDFLYRYWLPGDRWAIYQGTGPSVNVFKANGMTSTQGGFNFVFGVRHTSGFFTEIKVGGSGSPSLRYGAGFTILTRPRNP